MAKEILSKEQKEIETGLSNHERKKLGDWLEKYRTNPADTSPLKEIEQIIHGVLDFNVIILPEKDANDHKKPLNPGYGIKKLLLIAFAAGAPPINRKDDFKIEDVKHPIHGTYHIFFIDHTGKFIDEARLANDYGITNVQVDIIKGAPVIGKAWGYIEHNIEKGVKIEIKAKYDIPKLTPGVYPVFICLAAQRIKYPAPQQLILDELMYEHAFTNAREAELRAAGVLDFNFIPLIIQNM